MADITLYGLAGMIQCQFSDVNKQFGEMNKRFDKLENGQKELS